MKTCAAKKKVTEGKPVDNLIFAVPDTDFRDFLDEVEELARFAPEIIEAIEGDIDRYAREKKKLRIADRKFFESRTKDFPAMDIKEQDVLAEELGLAVGRPRMSGYSVYVFLMIRGFLGSLTSKSAQRFLRESMSLYAFLQSRGVRMPGVTTILENVNLVSQATRERIFDRQIQRILGEGLDDCKTLTIDSTSVKANSSWPTDAKILTGLLKRAHRLGQKLHVFGVKDFRQGWMARWLQEMEALKFQIHITAGKAKSKGRLKKHYRRLLKRGAKAAAHLAKERAAFEEISLGSMPPSRRVLLTRVLEQIQEDITDSYRVLEYAHDRVFKSKLLSSTQKILSLSDRTAAYIKKGDRTPVIGYKPQLVRTGNGFITSLIVPEGNAADAIELAPVVADSMRRTGVRAELVSTDDGYASKKGRETVLAMDVEDVSISGAKGRKLTDEADWESEKYRQARRMRSAVESLMFTIKDGFAFGELGRRGLEAVRAELLEKVLAYNCCRIILMKKRRREAPEKAA